MITKIAHFVKIFFFLNFISNIKANVHLYTHPKIPRANNFAFDPIYVNKFLLNEIRVLYRNSIAFKIYWIKLLTIEKKTNRHTLQLHTFRLSDLIMLHKNQKVVLQKLLVLGCIK